MLDQSDLRTDLGAYLVGVADDAHFSALGILKVGERRHNEVERGVVEVAETLVNEEAADAQIVARERGKSQGQRETDNEGFAARK